ncbi:MAG: hypothetical protein IPF51_14695 [Dehalococcoidia bacterium]|uniref:hypothetical protein n=1 Tax=Candidatus Amarobacter glycogenicus TaxID=3140699 RepID=UPI0031348AF3|nr:hypothetical protein [Dehalococcoidia bacterium]
MSSNTLNPRKPLFWAGAAAIAAACFAAGVVVARATDEGDDAPPASSQAGPSSGADLPAEPSGASPFPGTVAVGVDGKDSGGRGGVAYGGCTGPIPAGVVSAAGIDPAKAGFVPALPANGFTAQSVGLAATGDCTKEGVAISGALTLSTTWKHDASGIEAYITQRVSQERVASVLRVESATFWANGYQFTVGVSAFSAVPMADDTASGNSSDGSRTSGSAPAASPRPPQPDPAAAAVLRELVGQVAPAVDLKCFWTLGEGDWSSLGALRIGDPRPAIPAGFSLQDVNVTAFTPPPAGCDTSLEPSAGFSFNANWQQLDGKNFAYLGVSVYGSEEKASYPGQIGDWGANWSRDGLQFSVYGKSDSALGIDTIRAIAKALDPGFNEACFIRERKLAEGELAGLGFSPAKAPAGYKLESSNLMASEIGAACPKPDGWEPNYSLNWTFLGGATVIQASANRYGTSGSSEGAGYQSSNYLSWTSRGGTQFSVNAYSKGISPDVDKDDLVAVAKSMDPTFDLSKLDEQPDGIDLPAPMPAEKSSR